jgi:ATP-dependent DNA helicase UvrD/PcrA
MSPARPLAAQRRAIEAPLGPVLVVAGPGAGKTYCLIKRVEHLLRVLRVPAERICAVTFTNKAAEEITTRLRDTLEHAGDAVTRGTLHWLCAAILRDHPEAVGLRPGFGIADEPYQDAVLRRLGVWRKRRSGLLTRFGRRRLQGYALKGDEEPLFRHYLAALRDRNVVDFDDLISLTAELLERHPATADQVASRWDYVLVDEGQDLDPTQYLVLKRLAAQHRNIFVVGDDEQSIFSWRGAEPAVLQRFQHDFGIEEPIVLDKNRRCSRQIFETARRLVETNPNLFDKRLSAERHSEHEVLAYAFPDPAAEAAWLLADVRADRERSGRPWGEYALLYRTHQIGSELEQQFLAAGLPCRLAQGRAVGEDEVVGHVVACLRIMLRPDDPVAQEALAARVLPEPLLERLRAVPAPGGFVDAVREYARTAARGDPDARKAWRYVYQVENLAALRKAHSTLAGVVPELLVQRVGKYTNPLEEHYEELSDPATHAGAVRLAGTLRAALGADGRIWLTPAGGAEVALRGMLLAAGHAGIGYLTPGAAPLLGDAVIGSSDAGEGGLTVTLFKALQLLRSRDFTGGLSDYVAFDLETGDLDVHQCEIVEIGAVRVRGGEPVAEFRTLVKGSRPISPRATAVHGYRDTDVADAPTLAQVWPAFRAFVGQDVLVAHNGQQFDVPVLRRAAHGLEGADGLTCFDTFPLARSLWHDSAKLETLAARFGIDVGHAHHALDDARTLARVVGKLGAQQIKRARIATLTNLLDWVGLGVALEGVPPETVNAHVPLESAASYALGRYSECLEIYAAERERLAFPSWPPVDEVIARLGGSQKMARLRAAPDPSRRYPGSMARLDALVAACEAATLDEGMRRLLERVALSTTEGPEVVQDRVNLLTLHSTKGLEFDCVYIVGVEDGQIPGVRPGREVLRAEIEEARRLLYVGMTRARDRLVLTRARERNGVPGGENRFLDEMGVVPASVSRTNEEA